jgi:hypothetical protein
MIFRIMVSGLLTRSADPTWLCSRQQFSIWTDPIGPNRELLRSYLLSKYFTDFKKSSVSVGSSQ